jgi:hypothetical protein
MAGHGAYCNFTGEGYIVRRLRTLLCVMVGLIQLPWAMVHGQQPVPVVGQTYRSLDRVTVPGPTEFIVPAATPLTTQPVVQAVVGNSPVTVPLGATVVPASATSPLRSLPSFNRLREALRNAKTQLSVDRIPKVDSTRRDLEIALSELEQFVGPGTENGKRWSRFLQLDVLQEELTRENPRVPVLSELEMNMRQNYLGLEYPQFLKLRDRLVDYSRALRYGAAPDRTLEFLGTKIDDLFKELENPTENSATKLSSEVGLLVDYLAEAEQSPALVSQLRGAYSYPNFQVAVNESFINRLVGRSVAEPSPVRECILGTSIFGNACLTGNVFADVRPMQQGVALRLSMNATLTSQSQGFNRGVVINTTGNSPVFASKDVFVTPTGISANAATASTHLQTQINSIEHKRRIVRRIATKRAAKQKPMADAIAEGRMQRRIQTQYDSQVNSQLAAANTQFSQAMNVSPPELRRVGLQRPGLNFYSTEDGVYANVVQAASAQLAASGPSPIPRSMSSQVIVEAHQSAIVNALDVVLGGRRIRNENLDEFAQQILGKVPPEVKQEADGEPWSVVLASYHPIELEFDNDAIKIVLRISQMTRGDQSLPEAASISATYVPSFRDGVLILDRQGPVDIQFGETRGMRVLTLKTFIKNKFEATFKEQFVIDRIDLASRFPRAPRLSIDTWRFDDGWMHVGVR